MDGDDVQITWFFKTAGDCRKIGQGSDYLWTIPTDQIPGQIVAVAEDSKGGTSYRDSNYFISDEYSIYDVRLRTIPEVLKAGTPALLIAEIRTALPGDYMEEFIIDSPTLWPTTRVKHFMPVRA